MVRPCGLDFERGLLTSASCLRHPFGSISDRHVQFLAVQFIWIKIRLSIWVVSFSLKHLNIRLGVVNQQNLLIKSMCGYFVSIYLFTHVPVTLVHAYNLCALHVQKTWHCLLLPESLVVKKNLLHMKAVRYTSRSLASLQVATSLFLNAAF